MYLYVDEDIIDFTSMFGFGHIDNPGTMYFIPCSRNELSKIIAITLESSLFMC